jgi:nicotinamidase-related amidase
MMNIDELKIDRNSLLLIVDVQDKLLPVISSPERLERKILLLIELSKLFQLPILLTEQYPQGLGLTSKHIRNALPEYKPLEKTSFSILGDGTIREKLKEYDGRKIILTGIETHICILQSGLDLIEAKYPVVIPYDAVDSRNPEDGRVALHLLEKAGAVITGCETIAYQVQKLSATAEFKHLSRIIKEYMEPLHQV